MFPNRKCNSLNRIECLLEQILDTLTPVDTSSLDAVAQEGHRVSEEYQSLTNPEKKE